MSNSTENGLRRYVIFYSIILMLICLLISRAALSISMIFFLITALVHADILKQVKKYFSNRFLIAISFLFFIPFISGLWSDDKHQWWNVVQLKLPFLFFPIAFTGRWNFSQKQWQLIALIFLAIVFGGCVWSITQYISDYSAVHQEYLKAKTIITPLEDDHVRFSWLVSIAVVCCFLLLQFLKGKSLRALIVFIAVFFIIYLHILSVRTGLLSLYIFLLMYAAWLVKRNFKAAVIYLGALVSLPVIAWFFIPTFQNRIKYFVYDFSFVKSNTYLPGSNDGARALSIRSGWDVLKHHPFGVGAGDIIHKTDNWYAANVPGILPSDKFYPCSEWLMYGCFAGWIGVILFTLIIVVPFFARNIAYKFFWIVLCVIAACSFVFDIGLEVQYGIFLYTFILLWWWKWLSQIQFDGR